ncbi:MAG: glycosyltransferase family 39 protein [Anaerolineales bacterium]|nr:glycosyltransferase family 39 protein [Anaerolineales bacterium]
MKQNFSPTHFLQTAALILLLALGLGIRLFDLTDPPLDFHSTRQMLSLNKARGMYYQTLPNADAERRKFAIQQWKFAAEVEPEFFERVVAFTYQFTGEQTWVARVYSSLFWTIAAIFLFLLAREFTSANGALASTAVFLFLPYAVLASRSFQPDPLMVSLIVIFWWAVFHWAKNPTSYKWAILAGAFGGFAIFIKLVAAFFVIAGGLGALLGRESLWQTLRRPQLYAMSALGVLPGAAYIVYGVWISGYLGQQFGGRFMPALFLSPAYYLGWLGVLNLVAGAVPLLFAALSFYFVRERAAFRFLLGLWIGYFVFGLYFNYHISTHDYYSLPLVPILALSLAPLFDFLFESLSRTEFYAKRRAKFLPVVILAFGLFLAVWNIRADMKANDYRAEPAKWAEIGSVVGQDARLVGLVQDYGMRLAYWGWRPMTAWYRTGDFYYHEHRGEQIEFDNLFANETAKRDYFIVTDFDELNKQPLLKERLSKYALAFSGEGYAIFDLRNSK